MVQKQERKRFVNESLLQESLTPPRSNGTNRSEIETHPSTFADARAGECGMVQNGNHLALQIWRITSITNTANWSNFTNKSRKIR